MPLVVDASIAFKWFVPETSSAAALTLLDEDIELIAPDLIFAEIGNAMWARLRRIKNGQAAADAAQVALRRILTRTMSAPAFVRRAVEIAFELKHPVYDCIYLAMCEREQAPLVTADDGLRDSVAGTSYAQLIAEPLK